MHEGHVDVAGKAFEQLDDEEGAEKTSLPVFRVPHFSLFITDNLCKVAEEIHAPFSRSTARSDEGDYSTNGSVVRSQPCVLLRRCRPS